jgi:hypothetical protein
VELENGETVDRRQNCLHTEKLIMCKLPPDLRDLKKSTTKRNYLLESLDLEELADCEAHSKEPDMLTWISNSEIPSHPCTNKSAVVEIL